MVHTRRVDRVKPLPGCRRHFSPCPARRWGGNHPGQRTVLRRTFARVLHIISACVYCVLGAFQFSSGFRRRKPGWHRAAGRILVPCGLVAALSGLWLTHFYPPVDGDGPILYTIRLLAGSAMGLFISLGFAAILRRDIPRHSAWMMRAYAVGLGAGTQALTHLPWFLFPSIQGELARALCMGAGWGINLAVAEWIIRGRSKDQTRAPETSIEDEDPIIQHKEYTMRTAYKTLVLFVTLSFATQSHAGERENPASLLHAEPAVSDRVELYKDPIVATYLSGTLPGLGQFYTGKKRRGLLFLTSVVGAFGSAYAFYKPAKLELADYDKTDFGGNGDELLSTVEIRNWEDGKFKDDAFDQLSTTRKVGVVAGVVAGLGLYVWNVIDADNQAKKHNQRIVQRRVDLGLQTGPERADLALNLHF